MWRRLTQLIDREVELLHELASKVLAYGSELEFASELCGELDVLLALAQVARKYEWKKPDIEDKSCTYILGGRHPLYEVSSSDFIPNNFGTLPQSSTQRRNGILILTGPNHSGKSVYLKQVALIIYLAHIGSFVPAERAEISCVDKILVCMAAQESAAANESAFAADLKQVNRTLRQATEKSLVIIDEFGKGTCPVNGAGLAAGLLDHFLQLGPAHCPNLLIATHFHEIFESQSFEKMHFLHFAYFETHVNGDSEENLLTCLFILRHGRSDCSFGEKCAAMNGVPEAVINRAKAISLLIDRNEDIVAACARLSVSEQCQLEAAEEVARRFLSCDLHEWVISNNNQRMA